MAKRSAKPPSVKQDVQPSHSERTRAGQAHARKMGRSAGRPLKVSDAAILKWKHLGSTHAAKKVGLSRAQFIRRLARLEGRANDA